MASLTNIASGIFPKFHRCAGFLSRLKRGLILSLFGFPTLSNQPIQSKTSLQKFGRYSRQVTFGLTWFNKSQHTSPAERLLYRIAGQLCHNFARFQNYRFCIVIRTSSQAPRCAIWKLKSCKADKLKSCEAIKLPSCQADMLTCGHVDMWTCGHGHADM